MSNKRDEENTKYSEVYEGKKDLDEFFSFLQKNSTLSNIPMPNKKIKVIEKSLARGKKLPKQYLKFLKNAGLKFEQWIGSRYVLVTEDDKFLDLGQTLEEDEELYQKFLKYDTPMDDCFFFFDHQSNAYAFFILSEKNNDPNVYFVDDAYDVIEKKSRVTLCEMIIDEYNAFVRAELEKRNPWEVLAEDYTQNVLGFVNRTLNIDLQMGKFDLSHDFDAYKVSKVVANREDILRQLIYKCHGNGQAVYAYGGKEMYLYWPDKDDSSLYPRKISSFDNCVYFLNRLFEWGWVVDAKGTIMVFGDSFRQLVNENSNQLGIVHEKQSK